MRKKMISTLFISVLLITCVSIFLIINRKDEKYNYIVSNPENAFEELGKREDGIYFFYFPECPWCEEILPLLNAAAQKNKSNVATINIHSDKYSLKEKDYLRKIMVETGNGRDIIVPFTLVIRDHQIKLAKVGLIDSQIKQHRNKLITAELDKILSSSH